MNEIKRNTITTLEIAGMLGTEHWRLLRKIEGRTEKDGSHTRGYIDILNDNQMGVVDFFQKSSYMDAKGESRSCYEVTKMGCDFLANKFTGEKGILFTARYVKKFNEMESQVKITHYEPKATSLGEVARYTVEMDKRLERQGTEPYKIAEAFKMVSEQFGIRLPDDFVKIPEYPQINLFSGDIPCQN